MPIAAPLAAHSTAGTARRTRVAVAGATGYAGQELVRLLARHPAVTLTVAMSSGATAAPRPLPALARIWDGVVAPLDLERLAADADIVFLALPETASAEIGVALLGRQVRLIEHLQWHIWHPTDPVSHQLSQTWLQHLLYIVRVFTHALERVRSAKMPF